MEKFNGAAENICGRVAKEQVVRAVESLLKWENSRKQKQKAQLLEDDQLLYLCLSLKRIPDKVRLNPYQIAIPHPLFSLDGYQEACLFVNDRKGFRQKEAKQKVAEEKIPVAKVIGVSKLRTDYKPFESKRKLCGSYDIFLADKCIFSVLPKLLGKTFFKKKKYPIPVDLTKQNWSKQIKAVCGSTFLYIKGGTCSVLKVGRLSQTKDEIVENITAAIEGASSLIPNKWKNIRALHLKTVESVSLPIYQSLPEMPLKINVLHNALSTGTQHELSVGGTVVKRASLSKSDKSNAKLDLGSSEDPSSSENEDN
eukprot:c23756_g1_i1 orf=430-1362(-)